MSIRLRNNYRKLFKLDAGDTFSNNKRDTRVYIKTDNASPSGDIMVVNIVTGEVSFFAETVMVIPRDLECTII